MGSLKYKNKITNYLVSTLGFVFALAIMELICRIIFSQTTLVLPSGVRGQSATINVEGKEQDNPNNTQVSNLYLHTPYGLRLKPSTNLTISPHPLSNLDVEINVNSIGFRGKELGEKSHKRILMLGDSITMGEYLPEQDTVSAQVQELSGQGTDVLNFGVVGLGTSDELHLLKEIGLGTKPDLVILNFYLNDALASPTFRVYTAPSFLNWSALAGQLSKTYSIILNKLYPSSDQISQALFNSWYDEGTKMLKPADGDPLVTPAAFDKLILENYGDWGNVWGNLAWKAIEKSISEIHQLLKENNIEFKIVIWPVRYQVEAQFVDDLPQKRLISWSKESNIQVYDLLPALRNAWKDKQSMLYYDHCHPTLAANIIVANGINSFLQN